ncbi:hypothetical protein [Paenibacillus thiaminolyticus]|uniref:Uncharacterized protein n=1 Tax=Paenibacillus thiaminolyticus TaxID=49283 RepID=A0A3A3G9R1_PANTH|nr:hypothetical protein [Paenibacillus thiaminolyticus]RJG15636.1 hypothetical protein DQX05_29585 [Paenibacillus thiaminolyticus]
MHDYSEIIKALKQPLPDGAMRSYEENQNHKYFPIQVYIDLLESITEGEYNYEIRELEVNTSGKYVKAIVRIEIQGRFRDGHALCDIKQSNTANATDLAMSTAFKNALDKWQVGWINLAPFEKWGNNPGISLLNNNNTLADSDTCIKCGRQLTEMEKNQLKRIPKNSLQFCTTCLPEHLRRKMK